MPTTAETNAFGVITDVETHRKFYVEVMANTPRFPTEADIIGILAAAS